MAKGWKYESGRHSLAARGIKTGQRRRRGRYQSKDLTNLKMNPQVFKLRRRAMKYVYEAKNLTPLPRITIRITDQSQDRPRLATAGMGKQIIWIPADSFSLSDNELRGVIYHEILHTVFRVGHKKKGIMTPLLERGVPRKTLERQFLKEVAEAKEGWLYRTMIKPKIPDYNKIRDYNNLVGFKAKKQHKDGDLIVIYDNKDGQTGIDSGRNRWVVSNETKGTHVAVKDLKTARALMQTKNFD